MFLSPTEEDIRRIAHKSDPGLKFESLKRAMRESVEKANRTAPRREENDVISFQDLGGEVYNEPQKPSLMKYLHAELNNPFAQPNFEPSYFNPPEPPSKLEPIREISEISRPKERTEVIGLLEEEPTRELPEQRTSFRVEQPEVLQELVIPKESPKKEFNIFPDERRKPIINRKYKSMNVVGELPEPAEQKEIKVIFDERVRLAKLIDPEESIKNIISMLRKTLEMKGYIYRNVKNPLVLKDENDYELDEEEKIGYYLMNRTQFKLGFRKYGPEYALAAEGAFELLDIPERIIDMKQENGEYKFRIAWKKRKNGVQPLPSYASEKSLMCYNPGFLFDFYAGFAKRIVKQEVVQFNNILLQTIIQKLSVHYEA
eukprot:TRINITY_DN3501_c0_g1_i1.p4 TRINITY_DN3501_c0_g1~~TRINITY_DN3501_c0_g1_i1.p4  ORF type:complete len:372 (+),score=38.88 TRINITY_DN3501_c0_g1_i1:3284-4399(+)